MELNLDQNTTKEHIFNSVNAFLIHQQFRVLKQDLSRPWGGYFVIDDSQAEQFIAYFFSELESEISTKQHQISPKILIVEPNKKLSWQYHYRRSEIWKVIDGTVGVIKSQTDIENPLFILKKGESISIEQGERHRLIGLNNWGIIAEIWQHSDNQNPSNEDDIVRVQDDFGR